MWTHQCVWPETSKLTCTNAQAVDNVLNHKFNIVDGTVKSADISSVKKELQMQIKLAGDQWTTNQLPVASVI